MSGPYNHHGSQRFEHVEGKGWYVRTREGRKGPFSSRPEAEVWLAELVRDQLPRHTHWRR